MPERNDTAIVQLKVRMREPLRAQLEQAAKGTGHSMNAEILERLDRSFERQDLAVEVLTATYGRQLTGLLTALGRTMKDTGAHAGFILTRTPEGASNWLGNPYAFDQAAKAVETIIEAFRPSGEIVAPGEVDFDNDELNAVFADLGEAFIIVRAAVEAIFLSNLALVLHQAIATGIDQLLFLDVVAAVPTPRTALIPADILNPLNQIHGFTFLAIGAPDPGIVPVEATIQDLGEIALESQ